MKTNSLPLAGKEVSGLRLRGLEPPTLGSEDRCQLNVKVLETKNLQVHPKTPYKPAYKKIQKTLPIRVIHIRRNYRNSSTSGMSYLNMSGRRFKCWSNRRNKRILLMI